MFNIVETDRFRQWLADRHHTGDVLAVGTMSRIKSRPFDPVQYMTNEESIAQYLQGVMEEGDTALLAAALGDIARARGMTQLARDAELSPSSDTLFKVMKALGFQLTVKPLARGTR